MKVVIVDNVKEFDKTIKEMKKEGLKLACMSNTGLSGNKYRLTFLPKSCFNKERSK